MKANKLLLATALFAGLAALSFAGPGPQFWNQQEKTRKEIVHAKALAAAQAKAQPATQVAVCANCTCPAMKKP
jgi:hypothetical protein